MILTRSEYAELVDTFGKAIECIASYRVICHHLAPLLYDAINECDDPQELTHLRSLLDQLKRGES